MTILCLQGGAEFGPDCRPMDRELVELAGGPVVVAPMAAAVGVDYRTTADRGVRYFLDLGVAARPVPDPREDLAAGLGVLRDAAMVVLPGGSPSRLRDALAGPVTEVLRERFEQGALLCGASAGAMLLCEWTILPERDSRPVRGLGLLAGVLVLPHYRTGSSPRWEAPAGVQRLGIPERSGVLVGAGPLRSLGVFSAEVLDPPPGSGGLAQGLVPR